MQMTNIQAFINMAYSSVFGAILGIIDGAYTFSFNISTYSINMTMKCWGSLPTGTLAPGTATGYSCT